MSPKLKDASVRSARTFAQSAIAVLIASGVADLSVGALQAAGIAGLSAVLSLAQRLLEAAPEPR